MAGKQQPALAELKVGIFVLVTLAVLALAIFAIGSQVGLFEEQFWAVTYLSNVSGLKPGDVVLLGGVEVGNVTSVEISAPGELPATVRNTKILQQVAVLEDRARQLREAISAEEPAVQSARLVLQDAEAQAAPAPRLAALRRELEDREKRLADLQRELAETLEDIQDERRGLQNIVVEMRVNQQFRDWIRADSEIALGSIGLLGDKYIEISLGRSDQRPEVVRRTVSGLFFDSEEEFVLIAGTQQASFGELITGANDILANFETLSAQVQDIMRSFRAGEGTIGKFITDPSFFNNLNSTVENANATMEQIGDLVADIKEGQGTIARLIQDDALHQRLVSTTESLERLLQKLDSGEGTLGRFVNDDSIYQKTDEVLANVSEISGRINRGEGTLGRLSREDELYVSLRDSVRELSALLKDVEAGKGTLGLLAKDEQLYRNLNDISSEMTKLIYDFRQNPKKFLTIKFELF